MRNVHIGRQAIYDRENAVHGYELRFRRSAAPAPSPGLSPDLALSQLILNTVTEHGLDTLAGSKQAFLTVTRPFLVGDVPIPFGPDSAVLELVPQVEADDSVLEGCKLLADAGYRLALDDFRWEPGRVELLPYASYVKVDAAGRTRGELAEAVELCEASGVASVAQNVGDSPTMESCRDLGFDYFQGSFFLRPEIVVARTMTPSHLAGMQVLAKLSNPEFSLTEVEDIVRTDLALSYRVLRAANAASRGVTRQVETIRDALVLLGARQLRSWLLLMVLADSGSADEEQLTTAMTRARTCELLAEGVPGLRAASAFVVGVLSAMDLVLGIPMAQVVDRLPLAEDLRLALVEGRGPLGEVLNAVLAYENGDDTGVATSPFDGFELSRAYLSAVGWSLQLCESALSA
jgi:c-di-GMP-related signal transduction protein